MMVTFVSQCEHKALNRTRRVLDAFANRIGSRTWQTVITEDGLQAVKKLLRKTATKNTAVSCHWLRSRSRTELAWIVGNRAKFNQQGVVPVNWTQKNLLNSQWENDWHTLPLIKALTALAGLFHDWGKASACFQAKLKNPTLSGDPLRHEWVSVLLLSAFVNQENDEQWLQRLIAGDIKADELITQVQKNTKNPLKKLPPAANLISWLIISHHRLPLPRNEDDINRLKKLIALPDFNPLLGFINADFGYANLWQDEQQARLAQCFIFDEGLPNQSKEWLKHAKKWANKLQGCLPLLEKSIADGSWRLVIHHAHLSLMLGDHHYSSQPADLKWCSEQPLYANTDRESGQLKQKLDEHLLGVTKAALNTAHLLPAFEDELPRVFDIKALKQKSTDKKYTWQDKAVEKISHWKNELPPAQKQQRQGFFAVNMASTGCGKTFANAKVMRALSVDGESLRYVLALGLRSLTLQTGDEYRERICLDNSEMAVLIGSKAMLDLHQHNKQSQEEESPQYEEYGSESMETLLDDDIDYECAIPETHLNTVLTDKRSRQFLYAPVLVCTIDHLMAATETKRGGRYILPTLRLMSSDLVIDELDDFDGKDLIAIARLCHLAGMLGGKVMISSATIPPDLAEGYFNAYQEGWSLFAKTRDVSSSITCAWIDEFSTQVHTVTELDSSDRLKNYQMTHQGFVKKRLSKLALQTPKRKAEIITCTISETHEKQALEQTYFADIQQAIVKLHQQHHNIDPESKKQVSFGVVRVANIPPCIKISRYLAQADWGDDTEIRTMAYHAQQILLMRSAQEKHLDSVLKRSHKTPFQNSVIRQHLNNSKAKNLIFILVATPVEEVGRDHDFDWAVVEPSSYRSIIQLAGRVLRHRAQAPETANMALMQYNLKALIQNSTQPAYCYPGYESTDHLLETHDLKELLSAESLAKTVDASLRIQKNSQLNPKRHLADLEHACIAQLLTAYQQTKVDTLQGWLTECWWLTALPQQLIRFRASREQQKLYFIPDKSEESFEFIEKDREGRTVKVEQTYQIVTEELGSNEKNKLWLTRDYEQLLTERAEIEDISMRRAALKYGEINIPIDDKDRTAGHGFVYVDQFGMMKRDK